MTAASFWKEMLPVLEGPKIIPMKAAALGEGKGVGWCVWHHLLSVQNFILVSRWNDHTVLKWATVLVPDMYVVVILVLFVLLLLLITFQTHYSWEIVTGYCWRTFWCLWRSFLSLYLYSLFSTIASAILFQMTVASCLEFYGSLLLAFLYLIWPPHLSVSTLQPELLF